MMNSTQKEWQFVHLRSPVGHHGRPVTVEGHFAVIANSLHSLEQAIREFITEGRPALAHLLAPDGQCLALALHPMFSSIYWHYKPGYTNCRVIIAVDGGPASDQDFSLEGGRTSVARGNLLPTEDVLQLVRYFFLHLDFPIAIMWRDLSLLGLPDIKLPEFRGLSIRSAQIDDLEEEIPF